MTASVPPVDINQLLESRPGVYGGRVCLVRSGLPVLQLAADLRSGMQMDDLKAAYPEIDDASLHAGLAYYFANRELLDAELAEREFEGSNLYTDWASTRGTTNS
jgi:uncharacterized protein (DUF433 family)